MEKHGFISNLSILDLLFNLGPASTEYLENINIWYQLLTFEEKYHNEYNRV